MLLLLVSACGGEPGPAAEPVRVEAFTYSLLPGGARILTGQLVNPGSSPIKVAQIQISLFDADNRRVSSMYIEVRDVPAGDQKAFREAVRSELDIQGARVKGVIVRKS